MISTIRVHAPLTISDVLRFFLTRIHREITAMVDAYADAQKMARESDKRYPFVDV
jgi:hypothetical protein